MKKTIFTVLIILSVLLSFIACDGTVDKVYLGGSSSKHTGNGIVSETNTTRTNCDWVQLWEGGPKFAAFNVGATITSYTSATTTDTNIVGGLYTWGGTQDARTSYTDDHCTATDTTLTSASDTATRLWGANWRMPTKADLEALTSTTNCTWIWCSGETGSQYETGCALAGYKVSGIGDYENDSIFLPAAGDYSANTDIENVNSKGYYWSTMPKKSDNNEGANYLSFESNKKEITGNWIKYGYSVRAVYTGK